VQEKGSVGWKRGVLLFANLARAETDSNTTRAGGRTCKVWAKEKEDDEQKKTADNLPSHEVAVAVAVGVVAGRPREQVPFARMEQSL
jgi:hypothetical protein